MKKILTSCAAGAFALAGAAFAGEVEDHCVAVTAEGGDPSGCSCLDDAASGNADMTAEILAVASEADVEALSEEAKAAIQACWPDS